MDKSRITPLIIGLGFMCLAFALWLIPTQAQDVTKQPTGDEQAAKEAMDAFAQMGSSIVNTNSQADDHALDVESASDITPTPQQSSPPSPTNRQMAAATDSVANDRQAASGDEAAVRVLLVPVREVAITSLTVDSVKQVMVSEGERVEKGQVLVAFTCSETRASSTVAKSRLAQYTMIHEANEELFKEDAITELDLELSRAKIEEGKGEVAFANAQSQRCTVKAPYEGTAVVVNIKDFANVQIGEPLLTIIDDSGYELILNVPSMWLKSRDALMNEVFKVTIDETGKTYRAVVAQIGSVIDPSSRTVELTALITGDNPELVPGMSGNAAFSARVQ